MRCDWCDTVIDQNRARQGKKTKVHFDYQCRCQNYSQWHYDRDQSKPQLGQVRLGPLKECPADCRDYKEGARFPKM